jgi:hypothetical protein
VTQCCESGQSRQWIHRHTVTAPKKGRDATPYGLIFSRLELSERPDPESAALLSAKDIVQCTRSCLSLQLKKFLADFQTDNEDTVNEALVTIARTHCEKNRYFVRTNISPSMSVGIIVYKECFKILITWPCESQVLLFKNQRKNDRHLTKKNI